MATNPLLGERLDLLLSPSNKLVLTNGDLTWALDVNGVLQLCRIALQLFAEEWFLNLDAGIRYFQSILGVRPDLARRAAELEFSRALAAVPGVAEILLFNVDFVGDTRTLTLKFQVRTKYGDTPVDTLAVTAAGGIS